MDILAQHIISFCIDGWLFDVSSTYIHLLPKGILRWENIVIMNENQNHKRNKSIDQFLEKHLLATNMQNFKSQVVMEGKIKIQNI